jgi:hypothetical protein
MMDCEKEILRLKEIIRELREKLDDSRSNKAYVEEELYRLKERTDTGWH